MADPNANFSEIATTTIDNYSSTIADNVLKHNALLRELERRGNVQTFSGGVTILQNLSYAENSTSKWYTGLELLDVSGSDVLTTAQYDIKQYNVNVVISGLEQIQNASRQMMHDLLKARIGNADSTARNDIGTALYFSNTENDGKSIGGLQHLIADDPTSGTVGGIDRATNTWWRNQVENPGASPNSAAIQTAMNKIYIRTTRGTDTVNMFVGDTTYFELYLAGLQANQRFADDSEAGAGFRALMFWGGAAKVFFDPACPANHMYGINSDFLLYRPHSARNFVRDQNKVAVNQDGMVVPLYWAGNLTLSNAERQGVIIPGS